MTVTLTTPIEGLTVGQQYTVAVIHYEGYELHGDPARYPVDHFEVVPEEQEEP